MGIYEEKKGQSEHIYILVETSSTFSSMTSVCKHVHTSSDRNSAGFSLFPVFLSIRMTSADGYQRHD